MRLASVLFVIIFVGGFFYFGWNNYEIPTYFWFQETKIIKGEVTKTKAIRRGRGYYQMVDFKYTVADSTYYNYFVAGQRQGVQSVGGHISIEYAIEDPQKSKVIGFYRMVYE